LLALSNKVLSTGQDFIYTRHLLLAPLDRSGGASRLAGGAKLSKWPVEKKKLGAHCTLLWRGRWFNGVSAARIAANWSFAERAAGTRKRDGQWDV